MEQLKVNLMLPIGDEREIKTIYTEKRENGTWDIMITVSPDVRATKLSKELVDLYNIFDDACSKIENLAKRNREYGGN